MIYNTLVEFKDWNNIYNAVQIKILWFNNNTINSSKWFFIRKLHQSTKCHM